MCAQNSRSTTACAGTGSRRGRKSTTRFRRLCRARSRWFSPARRRAFLYPGDPGIPNTLAPDRSVGRLATRVGIAWSPHAENSFLRKFLGAPGTTSIRASFGTFLYRDRRGCHQRARRQRARTAPPTPAPPRRCLPRRLSALRMGPTTASPSLTNLPRSTLRRSIPTATSTGRPTSPSAASPATTSTTARRTPRSGCFPSSARPGPNTVLEANYVGTATHRQRVLDRSKSRQSRSVPEPEPARAKCMPGTLTCGAGGEDTRLLSRGRRRGERNPRAARTELRQQRAAVQHRPRQLQRARAERAPHHRTAGVFRRLHLQQVDGSIVEHRRRSQPFQPVAQLRALRVRREAQLCREL